MFAPAAKTSTGAFALAALLVFQGCDALTRGEELPPVASPTQRSQALPNDRYRVWPRSGEVEEGVEYIYETGHCGLTYELDFDGSFWKALNPEPGKESPSFFINYDKGYITLRSHGEARYESSTGQEVTLKRLDGPIELGPCS